MSLLKSDYQYAIKVQALYAILCVVWNAVGLWQIQQGVQSIGPSASITVIVAILLLLSSMVICLYKKWEVIYLGISLLVSILAVLVIYGGFTKDRELWPSEFWRYAGIVVNLMGVLGFLVALRVFVNRLKEQ